MRNGTLWIALALILVACGDEALRPDRTGQTPAPKATGGTGGGDSSGGSGGTAGTSAAGQSGSGGVGGSAVIPLPNCDDLCVWEVEVSGDCPANATEECRASFQAAAATQGPACLSNLEAWCLCLRNNTDASMVSCTGGPVTSNIPVINGEVTACNTETEAWSACL